MTDSEIYDVVSHFCDIKSPLVIEFISYGHINRTYKITNGENEYVLQKINTNVFKEPDRLMENIVGVTEFLKAKTVACGGDPNLEVMTVIPTLDNKSFYRDEANECYRLLLYVHNSVTYNKIERKGMLKSAASAFGRFQYMLSDYPTRSLHETIPAFHDMHSRLGMLDDAVKRNAVSRGASVKQELDFINARRDKYTVITDALNSGKIPLRITHNDTKLNNVLFDKDTDVGICVIDLDTVMCGSLLSDFGDGVRFGANNAAEDEPDKSKVFMVEELFREFAEGYSNGFVNTNPRHSQHCYANQTGQMVTDSERKLLPISPIVMTYELAVRFLTDYLNGDTYFSIGYKEHNLIRTRAQIKLVSDMEEKLGFMTDVCNTYF